jgi:dipeptidyl aminopeptidase/acylaminoacyl peptidase
VAVGGVLALSLAAFWLVVRPPRLAAPLTPADVGLRVEAVRLAAPDGVRLAGWLVERAGRPGVILLHGYPANKADLLPLAATLAPHFTVLLMDLRFFGDSGGRVTTLGHRERHDVVQAVQWLARRGAEPVGVFGLSLGGAVALLAAAEEPRIRAVAAYAPFADLRLLGRETYGPLAVLMRLWGRLFLGADITRPAPVEAAARLAVPVLLAASREDEQIGFRHAERLRQALAGNPKADFHFLERGRHGDTGADFPRRLVEFFRAHLDRPAMRR